MRCPECISGKLNCFDTREIRNGEARRRRYKCSKCEYRISSVEIFVKNYRVKNDRTYFMQRIDLIFGLTKKQFEAVVNILEAFKDEKKNEDDES